MKLILQITVFLIALTMIGAERVVSLTPNLTELVFALEQEKKLVGRSSACDYPEAAKKIPIAGDFAKPSLEPLAALRPTLVISEATRGLQHATAIRNLGIKFVSLPSVSIADYLKNIASLGELLGCKENADELIKQTKKDLQQLRSTLPPLEQRPKVIILISDSPLITVGRSSFINEMIELAGGRNVGAVREENYFTCSMEYLVEQQPDVLIMAPHMASGIKKLKQNPAWQGLPAVKNNRIHANIDPAILYRLGPRTVEGIKTMRKLFFPDPSQKPLMKGPSDR